MYKYLKQIIFKIDPEIAHAAAIKMMKYNCIFDHQVGEYIKPYLSQTLWGLNFDSPVGLAAGFDKNGELSGKIHYNGFGFAEIGTTTPFPQKGNEKPRLFRLTEEEALVNRLGFNNDGIQKLIENVSGDFEKRHIPLGINIGPNKDSSNFIDDYIIMLDKIYDNYNLFSYITINISSPNTPGLRDLQKIDVLKELLEKINNKVEKIIEEGKFRGEKKLPIFLKISPDINEEDITDIVHLSLRYKISALIISNTTINHSYEKGGLSGKPLFEKSTKLLGEVYKVAGDQLILIGVGGISSAEDAYTKIKSGASLVQLYTAMVYQGPFVAHNINEGLVKIMQRDGVKNIKEIIGIDIK